MPETKVKKTDDFNEWYNEIVELADLCDKRYPIKGMNVWRPYGWTLMNHVDRLIRNEMMKTNHQEVYFPLLIPESSFKKEEEHIEGFGSEVYWITTAVFAEAFIETSMGFASGVGMTGSIKILITDSENNSLENISIKINGLTGTTDENGIFSADNTDLGILSLELTHPEYNTQKREILVTPLFKLESTIIMEPDDGSIANIKFDITGCSLVIGIFSIFALIGTITCLKRQHLDVAIASSLIGILSIGFFFIGSIISIIAFAIIMTSKEEFENGKKGKTF